MQRKFSKKFILIAIILVIIAIGAVIALFLLFPKNENSKNNVKSFQLTTTDVAVYEIKEGDKLTIVKANLDGSGSSTFYKLEVQKPASNLSDPFPQITIMDNKIFRGATQNNSGIKTIMLNGEENPDLITESENSFIEQGSWVVSPDKTLKMQFQPISPQREIGVITKENERLLIIDADQTSHPSSDIRPVGFSPDDQTAYFIGTAEDDMRSRVSEGLYAYSRLSNNVKEIFYSNFEKDQKAPHFLFFDSSRELAYLLENDRITQLNSLTKEKREVAIVKISSANDIHLSNDGKTIFIDSQEQTSNKEKTTIVAIDTEKMQKKDLPIFGEFKYISSDGKFLIYSKSSRTPYGSPVNVNSPTGESIQNQEFLDRTEYRSFDLQTRKDILLVADEQITNTFEPKKKEVTFLGLITTNNQNQNFEKKSKNQGFDLNINNKEADQSWKTYHNDKYNYSFTYPSKLIIDDGKYNQNDIFFKDSAAQTPDVIHIAVSSTDLRGLKTIDDWIKSYSQEGYIKEKDIVIDNAQGILVDIKIGDEVVSGNKKIVFIKNDLMFEINFHQVSDAAFTIEHAIDTVIKGLKFEK